MVRGLYTAASGALAAQAQSDVTANNLANVSTAGFKRTLLQIQSAPTMNVYMMQNQPSQTNPLGTPSSSYVGPLGTGAQIGDTPAIFAQGPLQMTNNPLDVALQGTGLLAVQTANGVRYTRDGHLGRDGNGYLVTMDGNRVLGGNGPIRLDAGAVTIRTNGDVVQNGATLDSLRIVRFANTTPVRPQGDNLFDAGGAQSQADTQTTVHQGFLEGSNANVVRSMVDLIDAQRWFEANIKMIQTQDTANGYALANVGRTNAQ